MIIDPGIIEAANSKGIKFLVDANHDGILDKKDLNAATMAQKG